MFALLAGVSLALLSGGAGPVDIREDGVARIRIMVRGLLVLLLGAALVLLGTPIAVILPVYGVLFLAALPVLRARPRQLLTLAGVCVLAGPPLAFGVTWLVAGNTGRLPALFERPLTNLLFTGTYPAVVWFAYVLVGLAVGRLDLRSGAVRVRLAVVGVLAGVVGYGGSVVARLAYRALTGDPAPAGVDAPPPGVVVSVGPGGNPSPSGIAALLTARAHDDTAFEVVGNIGVALVVLAVLLVAAERAPRLLAPLTATGALALTVYTAQILAIAALGPDVVWEPRNEVLLWFVAVTLVVAPVWRHFLGRGPLERLLHTASVRAAGPVSRAPDVPGR
jgi:hypothetical protein